jgi:hypothetical protein
VELEGGEEISYYKDAAQLIEQLGEQGAQRDLKLATLQSLAFETIRSGLRHSPLPPRTLWLEQDPELRYSTEVTKAELLEVMSQHRYVRGNRAVLAVNSRWRLVVTSLWQPRDTDQPGTWAGIERNDIEGELQLLIEEDAGELRTAELMGAELTSSASLATMDDGSIISIG